MSLETPGQRIDEYEVVEALGRGGMASVLRVRHIDVPDLQFALKLLHSNLADEAGRKRFAREARSLARIRHPNVLQVVNLRLEQDPPYMVMELLPGQDLAATLKDQGGPVDPVRVLDWMLQAAQGLAAAHGQGIVHRDIKLANLFLTDEGVVKVMDFGIALDTDTDETQLTATGALVGTPEYIPPEVAMGERPDTRMDVYGIGVCLYHLLVGAVPFRRPQGTTPQMAAQVVLRQIIEEGVPDPRKANDLIPPILAQLTMRLAAKRPEDRPADATAMVQAIEEARTGMGQDLTSRPPPTEPVSIPRVTTVSGGTLVTPKPKRRALPLLLALSALAGGLWFSSPFLMEQALLLERMDLAVPLSKLRPSASKAKLSSLANMAVSDNDLRLGLSAVRVHLALDPEAAIAYAHLADWLHGAWVRESNQLLRTKAPASDLLADGARLFPQLQGAVALKNWLPGHDPTGTRLVSESPTAHAWLEDAADLNAADLKRCVQGGSCPASLLSPGMKDDTILPANKASLATALCAGRGGSPMKRRGKKGLRCRYPTS